MATISGVVATSSESPSVILPASTLSNDTTCGDGDTTMMQAYDDPGAFLCGAASSSHARVAADESTQGALGALAALAAASSAVSIVSEEPPSHPLPQQITPHQTSSDDDSEIMPPPPPRNPTTVADGSATISNTNAVEMPAPSFSFLHDSTPFSNMGNAASTGLGGGGRLRSASNPEGMEKWDLYSQRNDRQHFVLPSSILEEELASTRRVLGEVVEDAEYNMEGENTGESAIHGLTPQPPQEEPSLSVTPASGFQQLWSSTGVRRSKRTIARLGTSPDSVYSDLDDEDQPTSTNSLSKSNTTKSISSCPSNSKSRKKVAPSPPEIISKSPPPDEEEEEHVDESTLEPEELLRRARSRLLEDLSEGSGGSNGTGNGLNGDKGSVLILPHSLSKYKEVYNKNGRIGIYTPAERAAIIQKFNAKRARRVWNKKIRYNCRKNLADRRMRVKGRFVKRSVEAANSPPPPEDPSVVASETNGGKKNETGAVIIKVKATSRSSSPPTSGSPLTTVNEHEEQQQPMDEDMPDVNDEEAGFEPSDDMPYRRTRRYTIT